jgi:hypothetical protein
LITKHGLVQEEAEIVVTFSDRVKLQAQHEISVRFGRYRHLPLCKALPGTSCAASMHSERTATPIFKINGKLKRKQGTICILHVLCVLKRETHSFDEPRGPKVSSRERYLHRRSVVRLPPTHSDVHLNRKVRLSVERFYFLFLSVSKLVVLFHAPIIS